MSDCKQNRDREMLEAHTSEFGKAVIEVTDGVHVAVGFGLANSILIEGDDGVIVVDTMESPAAAEAVKAEFDKVTSKPVRAIIYTHNHYDHVYGAKVFAGDDNPDVYAHETLMSLVDQRSNVLQPAIFARSACQFGIPLPPSAFPNAGIGPRLVLSGGALANFIHPNKTFSSEHTFEVAGLKIKLVHAVGETDDQIYVWLPDKRTLLPADNFYKAFPNLYAIRGTRYRDVRKWVASLDKMIAEKPEHLVPSHTRPMSGAERIEETLTDYRDAIQSVFDQTIAGMNEGLTADQLVDRVTLPAHLAEKPYLQEYYGTVAWSVRSIFTGYLGWFDGNATNLFPMSPSERAARMVEFAGGEDALIQRVRNAVESGDYQWAAELADHVMMLNPQSPEAKSLKASALIALGERQISANARNYYLTSGMQLGGTPPSK
jgi:alkyl sulfatase BDS1-like metallo-beta-lactamase superfamily hydrolase